MNFYLYVVGLSVLLAAVYAQNPPGIAPYLCECYCCNSEQHGICTVDNYGYKKDVQLRVDDCSQCTAKNCDGVLQPCYGNQVVDPTAYSLAVCSYSPISSPPAGSPSSFDCSSINRYECGPAGNLCCNHGAPCCHDRDPQGYLQSYCGNVGSVCTYDGRTCPEEQPFYCKGGSFDGDCLNSTQAANSSFCQEQFPVPNGNFDYKCGNFSCPDDYMCVFANNGTCCPPDSTKSCVICGKDCRTRVPRPAIADQSSFSSGHSSLSSNSGNDVIPNFFILAFSLTFYALIIEQIGISL